MIKSLGLETVKKFFCRNGDLHLKIRGRKMDLNDIDSWK